ncbi:MAG: sulfatase-like hydrolase/transferase [Phycisphaerae bacterium]|nr:sulfatase-like hydrolase/transferase [Phycisphaerae bacterium]
MNSRRNFLKSVGVGAALGALNGYSPAEVRAQSRKNTASRARNPNVIYIIVDDMGPLDPVCYGGNKQKLPTPNIDKLAREGMRFTEAYSGCCVCAPARSVLMTGRHMGHTTVRGNLGGISLLATDVTVAEVLKQGGYKVGGFGKWGIAEVGTPGVPEKHGFDEFFGYYHQVHAHNYWTNYLWRNSKKVELKGKIGSSGRYTHHVIFERAKKFIRANKDRPFFCYCPWTPPHGRWQIPNDDPTMAALKDKRWPKPAKIYAAMIAMVDRHLGEVIDLLKELKIDDNTVVFFCSDNGGYPAFGNFFGSNGPYRGQKTNLYEGGIRIPLIVRWPGKIAPGTKSDLPWYFADVMPTLADLTGTTKHLPKEIDGISTAPTLTGRPGEQKVHEFLYWEYTRVANWKKFTYVKNGLQQAVRMGKWKLVRLKEDIPFELYDLSKDVGEKDNLAKKHPEIVKKMSAIARREHTEPTSQAEPKNPEGKRFR